MDANRPLPVTLDDFRVQCQGYTLRLSYRLNGQVTRVPLRDLNQAKVYINCVLYERLGAFRQAHEFDAQVSAFYGPGICPLAWRPVEEENV